MGRKRRRAEETTAPTEPEPMPNFVADARFVAARQLFERARARVTVEDVRRHAPGDPGYWEYVAAYTDILRRGEAAVSREFAVTETIALTRCSHANSEGDPKRFRWFRVLGCAIEILFEESDWPHYTLAALLVDSFALAQARDQAAPLDLLSAVCREVAGHPLGFEGEFAFCTLGELLLAVVDRRDDAAIETLCAALEPHGNLWTCTYFDALHPVWLDLVDKRCPVHPPVALALRKRLLSEGAPWMRLERRLS
jgi:hypothetical protein